MKQLVLKEKKMFLLQPSFYLHFNKIGKKFFKIVEKHFLKNGHFNKILNRKTNKISYF